MKVLVLYGTIEGQTAKIARFAAEELRKLGHEPVLQDSDDPTEIFL